MSAALRAFYVQARRSGKHAVGSSRRLFVEEKKWGIVGQGFLWIRRASDGSNISQYLLKTTARK
jgi:hypothetical protein